VAIQFLQLNDVAPIEILLEISIIIPAYNEEQRLKSTLEKVVAYLEEYNPNYEIIVVDDGSKDKTFELASAFHPKVRAIKQPRNMGKGAAVRTGMMAANGKLLLFSDADLSTPIYEINKIVEHIDCGFDVVIGSRAIDNDMIKVHQPFYREFMGKTFNKFVQLFAIKGIKDTQCGFKGFRSQVAKDIFSKTKIDGFGFDVEVLYLAHKNNYKIVEVPVEWYNDERSTVNPITDSFNMLLEILKVKKLHR